MPMVLLLGNHSSGKSTFINSVLGRRVQETGVAPTDDGFTLIVPGSEDVDQDGPALVGDTELGFTGLRRFGANLVNHVRLKIREDLRISDIMVVDSPGMIDSPVPLLGKDRSRDRGYEFTRVIRWFAERADVVLLFFDPDKPGTTGETLDAMTTSLVGLDHKTHIVLNKVDAFEHVHDFARAYGSLCWNLSKVIPRKDLPRIYTMCTPEADRGETSAGASSSNSMFKDSLHDLEAARQELLDEVHRAPLRRVDNAITRLNDAAFRLRMHLKMVDAVRRRIRAVRVKWFSGAAAAFVSGASLGGSASLAGLWELGAPVGVVGVVGAAGLFFWGQKQVSALCAEYVTEEGLLPLYQQAHLVELAQGDESLSSLWQRVSPQLLVALKTMGPGNLPKIPASETRGVDEIITHYVPELRAAASKAGQILFDDSFAHRDIDADRAVAK